MTAATAVYATSDAMVSLPAIYASFWSFSFGVSALATTGLHRGVAAKMDFSIRWRYRCLSLQFYYCNTAHPYFCASDAGKMLVRTERAVLMKAEDKE